jgi:NAD(P)-dependent dehydrogenase (short-subunit alcohol dehydrogenase family)
MVMQNLNLRLWTMGGWHYHHAILPALSQRFANHYHTREESNFSIETNSNSTESYILKMETNLNEAIRALGSVDAFAFFDSGYLRSEVEAHPDPLELHQRIVHELKRGLAFARLAAKHLVGTRRKGAITMIVDSAGMAGRFTALDASLYAAAMAGAAKSLAKELGRYGVRVNVLGYGFLAGFPVKTMSADENAMLKLSGLGNEMPAASFTATLAHLHETDCLINGQWILADGGLLI